MRGASMSGRRIDCVERHIEGARSRVYDALTDRQSVLEWLPPEEARVELVAFDPCPGGAFRMRLVFETSRTFPRGSPRKITRRASRPPSPMSHDCYGNKTWL